MYPRLYKITNQDYLSKTILDKCHIFNQFYDTTVSRQ